jgi:AraC-like DNA-binding protein
MSVIALLPDGVTRLRLRAALELDKSLPQKIFWSGDWADADALASRWAVTLVVFDPYVTGDLDLEAVSRFRMAFPSIVLLPYGSYALHRGSDLLRLAALGVQVTVERDHDDFPTTLARALRESIARGTAGRVLHALEDRIPEHFRDLIRYLLGAAYRPVLPEELARVYFRHPKTLRQHLKAVGLPCTEELIGWARLFHAADRLGDPGRTTEGVALALDFPSASAFRNQLRRYVGISPRRLATLGGLDYLLVRFRARLPAG